MPIALSVKKDFKRITRSLNRWQRKAVPGAANSALNRAGRKVLTVIVRDLAKEMGLNQVDIRSQIKIRKSNFRTLTVVLTAFGRRLNIIRFKARETKTGLVATPWRIKRKFRTGFIANQNRTAFMRLPTGRIRPLRGPGIASEFVRTRSVVLMKSVGLKEFRKVFFRELRRRFRK